MQKKSSQYIILALVFSLGILFGYLLGTMPNKVTPIEGTMATTCEFEGKEYKEGESFQNDCNSCSCANGQIACTLMACE